MTMKNSLIELYKQCFPEDSPEVVDYMFESYLGKHNALTEYDGDTLASAVYLVKKTLCYKQNILPLPYIVALGTATSHRYRGYSHKLIVRCLHKLYKDNIPFVALYPFKHSFYQKYDFFIPSFDYKLDGVKEKCDWAAAKQIYCEFCAKLDYYIVRNADDYEFISGLMAIENTSFYKVVKEDSVIGYTNGEESVPTKYTRGKKDGSMVRIVDARLALQLSKLTLDKKIKVTDTLVSENNFCCKLTDGNITYTDDYDIEMDISLLGEIIFGKKTLDGKNAESLQGYLADKY